MIHNGTDVMDGPQYEDEVMKRDQMLILSNVISQHQREGSKRGKKRNNCNHSHLKTIIHFHYSSLSKNRNIFSSHFQYSERTKATTETNNTSKESSKPQLLDARKT